MTGRVLTAVAAVSLTLICVPAESAYAEPGAPPDPIPTRDIKQHLEKFQAIADANGGTRAAGTSGDAASRDYVAAALRRAGYRVTLQAFEFQSGNATRTTYNLFAESRQGDADRVVTAGAHLDSVSAGPGINDNGSSAAGLLEVALRMATTQPKNRIRFVWWGAEELGLLGSKYYVANLSEADRAKIGLYLNFDMIASPNFAYKIRDGSAGPAGSAEIERNFGRYFDSRNLPHVRAPLNGRSDYDPFLRAGIPMGGLFTGAEGIKTTEEQRLFGGQAGRPYDSCYHRACDTTADIDDTALTVNTGAIADAVQTYAFSDSLPGARH